MKLLTLLLLLPSLALGQGLTLSSPWKSQSSVLWTGNFSTPGCYASGQTAGASSVINITRATPATYIDSNGTLQTCAANEFRVDSNGLLIEPTRVNHVLHSNSAATGTNTYAIAGWIQYDATVTKGPASPVGGYWNKVVGNNDIGRLMFSNTPSSPNYAHSIWVAKESGTGGAGIGAYIGGPTITSCYCKRSDNGTCTTSLSYADHGCNGIITDLGTTPVRLSLIITTSDGTGGGMYIVGYSGAPGSGVAGTTLMTGYQIETTKDVTSLCVSGATTCTRDGDQISTISPTLPLKWCIAVDASTNRRVWSDSVDNDQSQTILELGTHVSANSAYLGFYNGPLYFDTYGGATGTKSVSANPSWVATSTYRLKVCNFGGALFIYRDGALVSGASTGTGTGRFTANPATLYFGRLSVGAGSNYLLSGYLKNVKICATSSAANCQ